MLQTVTVHGTTLTYDTDTLLITVETAAGVWKTSAAPAVHFSDAVPHTEQEKVELPPVTVVPLTEAGKITHEPYRSGLGEGFITRFEDIPGTALTFETLLWVDNARGELFAEIIPLEDPLEGFRAVVFPAAFDFAEKKDSWYTVVTETQGYIRPNTLPYDVAGECSPYRLYYNYGSMPWFGQVRDGEAYIAISQTPFDAGYYLAGDREDAKTIAPYAAPSLGRLGYRRVTRYSFLRGDYNDLCALYRLYARETGLLVTLAEKAVRCPNVESLIGCAIVHEGAYWNCVPESFYYDRENPEKNTRVLGTFDERAAQLRALKARGLDKVYLHLDGWGVDGYDAAHPDVCPPNDPCGGWEGMKRLSDTCEELDYIFATHDNYRDYYVNASTYSEDDCVQDIHGDHYHHSYWVGGRQGLLCATQAPMYVRRNYQMLEEHGIRLRGTYQDVFTAVELDECFNPRHKMTREECAGYRKACFDYVMGHGIALSSEFVYDWAMQTMAFCHYTPWIENSDAPSTCGIRVPLLNLVYHDCVLQPAYLEESSDRPEGIGPKTLVALMMGNAGYLPIEPTDKEIERYRLVSSFQEKVQHRAMLRHEYLSPTVQRATYEGGITVTVDLENDTYVIEE